MGDVKDLLKQISETEEEQEQTKQVKKITDKIINQMVKNSKSKCYHWVATDETRQYYQEIYDFFKAEEFEIINYKTLVKEKGEIIQERSFDIIW